MPLYLCVFAVSTAVIGYEMLLMRIFSITQWSHFAWMIISLALLGFGASGTYLALARRRGGVDAPSALFLNSALFAGAMPLCLAAAGRVPFNPLETAWDMWQPVYIMAIYLLLAIPFFFAANVIGIAFIHKKERIGAVYRADLTGAGAGAALITIGLFFFFPAALVKILQAWGFAAAGFAAFIAPPGRRRSLMTMAALIGIAAAILMPPEWTRPRISEYKGLRQALLVPGARVAAERTSPLGLITAVESPLIPFRHAPGLSLNNTIEPPEQVAVFTDADAMTVITRHDGRKEPLGYLGYTTAALPYHLAREPKVLVLGAGGGADVLLARYHGAAFIDAVEPNPQVVELVRDVFRDFAGGIYEGDDVRVHTEDARGFARASGGEYDIIMLSIAEAGGAAGGGVHALTESYIYTTEAFEDYLGLLAPGGFLSVTMDIALPPRGVLKVIATARGAMEGMGAKRPEKRIALIRSWSAATILVKNGEFSEAEKDAVRRFSGERSFDVDYLPGDAPDEAENYNVLPEPYYREGAASLLGENGAEFIARYKFGIRPATDDRPYFFNFFRWRSAPEFFSLISRGGAGLMEWGYIILTATLAQAVVIGAVIVLLPLRALGRAPTGGMGAGVALYFTALGLGFMFIEISFIQKFTLFLSHPMYAVAVILSSFLVFAGIGSGYSQRLEERLRGRQISAAAFGVIGVAALYLVFLPVVFGALGGYPAAVKIAVSIILLAPLGFFMGMPFPLGLSAVARAAPPLVPWAWGINGCASVTGAALAALLAVHFGFTAAVAMAMALYAAAALTARAAFLKQTR